jgi:hypothetical protein
VSVGTLPGVAALRERLANFRYSLFRLETLQAYSGSSEDEAYAAHRAGQPIPVTPALRTWCDRVRRRVAAGAAVQRVHVVVEPPSEYLRFEVASYGPNVEAGEDVRILPVRRGGSWPADVGHDDFWLIDSRELWAMFYAEDSTWLGAEPVHEPRRIVEACFIRDAALAQAMSWSRYQLPVQV